LSKEELKMIMRIKKGQFPHVEVRPGEGGGAAAAGGGGGCRFSGEGGGVFAMGVCTVPYCVVHRSLS
jgi:hypothetical protein